jgi:hypothetical protein
MNKDYHEHRAAFLRQIRHMVETMNYAPWDVAIQYDVQHSPRAVDQCINSANTMKIALFKALDHLIKGDAIDSICNSISLHGYSRPLFPDNALGGQASALEDAALLIISLDINPYTAHTHGDTRQNVANFLNSNLHMWVLRLRQQWLFLPDISGIKSTIFNSTIPAAEPEKATLATMFKAVCHSLHIGPERPSPFINKAANAFSERYRIKLWPQAQPSANLSYKECILKAVSIEFQEWYFGCGRTQTAENTPVARRNAEDIFVSIRDSFHAFARSCPCQCGGSCQGACIKAALDSIPESDYKARCRTAVDSILLRMSST